MPRKKIDEDLWSPAECKYDAIRFAGLKLPRHPLGYAQRQRFLLAMAKTDNAAKSCKIAGVTWSALQQLLNYSKTFSDQVIKASEHAVDANLGEIISRAVHGVENLVVNEGRVVKYQGKPIIKREFSEGNARLYLQVEGGKRWRMQEDAEQNETIHEADIIARITDGLARAARPRPPLPGEVDTRIKLVGERTIEADFEIVKKDDDEEKK